MTIRQHLKHQPFNPVYYHLIKKVGKLDTTMFLCYLIGWQDYYAHTDKTNSGGYFYLTVERVENDLTIKKSVQARMIKELKELGLIDHFTEENTLLKKRYFKVNSEKIFELSIEADNGSHDGRFSTYVVRETDLSNNNKNNEKDSDIYDKSYISGESLFVANKTQNTLFGIPEKPDNNLRSKLSQRDLAALKIEEAEKGKRPWNSITFRDFAYFYEAAHNKIMTEPIHYDWKKDVSMLKQFIESHKIPKEEVCQTLIGILEEAKDDPGTKRFGRLSFYALTTSVGTSFLDLYLLRSKKASETIQKTDLSKYKEKAAAELREASEKGEELSF